MAGLSDRAGNNLRNARSISLSSSASAVRDHISGADRNDFYKIQLKTRSSLSLSLTGLRANLDVALLNGAGKVLRRSTRGGTQSETIQQLANAGTYYIRVYYQGANTRYRLTATAASAPLEPTSRPSVPSSPGSGNSGNVPGRDSRPGSVTPTTPGTFTQSETAGFDIRFDYRFDTEGWFTSERRAVLEAAAQLWKDRIQDEFEAVPVGTTLSVINPQTNVPVEFKSDYRIDDLVVFVGARSIDGSGKTLAEGGPSGYWIVGSSLETRFRGNKFEPWTASLSFDKTESWFFDPTPATADDIPSGQVDFLSIAAHELGHALGIGSANAYDSLVRNFGFIGNKAIALNGGNPVPVTADGHIEDGFIAGGVGTEALMDVTQVVGTRNLPTELDFAVLDDIGYSVGNTP